LVGNSNFGERAFVNVDVEDLLFELIAGLIELIGEFLIELLFELAAEALSALFARVKERHAATISAIGLILLGAISGLISAWLVPHRLIATRFALPGASLLLAPLITGFAMNRIGERMRRLARYPSEIATFRGGFLFALTMALIRLWLVVLAH
jgi:hypothetical protein